MAEPFEDVIQPTISFQIGSSRDFDTMQSVQDATTTELQSLSDDDLARERDRFYLLRGEAHGSLRIVQAEIMRRIKIARCTPTPKEGQKDA